MVWGKVCPLLERFFVTAKGCKPEGQYTGFVVSKETRIEVVYCHGHTIDYQPCHGNKENRV